MSGTDQETQAHQASLQLAFDTSYNVYQFATNAKRTSFVRMAFAAAAGIGSTFLVANPLVPLVIVNAAFLYDAYQSRATSIRLSDAFNALAADLEPDARAYLQPIAQQLKGVEPVDFKELHPVKQFQKNPVGVALAGLSLVFAPGFLPAMLAHLISFQDSMRFGNTAKAAFEVGETMHQAYGDNLRSPTEAPPSPDA